MRNPLLSRAAIGLVFVLSARPLWAQEPAEGAAPPAPGDTNAAAVAPVLIEHPDPTYPAEALRERIAGTVGLEIAVDETGQVVSAKVVQPAGHGFDEAALTAVKGWRFSPARQNDLPIRATVQLLLPFEPPEAPQATAP